MARANGSYPLGRWFEPTRRYHFGPLVKRLRHRPFTAVTRVQISYGSPYGSIAQLGEHLPYKQRVIGSSPIVPTIKKSKSFDLLFLMVGTVVFALRQVVLLRSYIRLAPSGIVLRTVRANTITLQRKFAITLLLAKI